MKSCSPIYELNCAPQCACAEVLLGSDCVYEVVPSKRSDPAGQSATCRRSGRGPGERPHLLSACILSAEKTTVRRLPSVPCSGELCSTAWSLWVSTARLQVPEEAGSACTAGRSRLHNSPPGSSQTVPGGTPAP